MKTPAIATYNPTKHSFQHMLHYHKTVIPMLNMQSLQRHSHIQQHFRYEFQMTVYCGIVTQIHFHSPQKWSYKILPSTEWP